MQEAAAFLKSRQPVNLLIVIVNIAVFLVLSFLGNTEDAVFMAEHGAMFTPIVTEGREYYRLVTSMFLHFGAEHLFYNMLVLIFLGDTLEKTVGKVRYFLIYMAGGVIGNVVSLWFDLKTESYAVSAGASGAVFAVIGALVCVVILNKGKLQDYSGKRLVLMAVLSVVQGLTASGIDNWAHMGGFVSGFLIALLFFRKIRQSALRDDEMLL